MIISSISHYKTTRKVNYRNMTGKYKRVCVKEGVGGGGEMNRKRGEKTDGF